MLRGLLLSPGQFQAQALWPGLGGCAHPPYWLAQRGEARLWTGGHTWTGRTWWAQTQVRTNSTTVYSSYITLIFPEGRGSRCTVILHLQTYLHRAVSGLVKSLAAPIIILVWGEETLWLFWVSLNQSLSWAALNSGAVMVPHWKIVSQGTSFAHREVSPGIIMIESQQKVACFVFYC